MEVKVVNCGIDSLVIGFLIAEYRNPEAFIELEKAKARAGEKLFGGKGSGVTWFGKDFVVSARGTKGYEWVLENADVRVCIARQAQSGKVYPEVYVSFRAEYLWREGHVGAVREFRGWLESWAVVKGDRVSRCDLCMDIQMDMPRIDLAQEAVTRSRGKVEYYEKCEHYVSGRRDTGYRMGSGALIARIYDKSLEVTVTQKQWFQSIWSANGWNGESTVIRVEFQARREFLKEMSVDSFLSLCERLADMWHYYTSEWLTIRVPCGDSHRDRWVVRDWWLVVQGAFSLFGQAYGVLRDKDKQYQLSQERLMKQAMGVLVSVTALSSARFGVVQGSFMVRREVQERLKSDDFRHDVIERMASMGTLSGPEKTHLVDAAVSMGGRISSVQRGNRKEG